MNDRQRNQVHRLIRVQSFCQEHAPKFTNTPPKAGDTKFNQAKTAIASLEAQIQAQQATQGSGGFSEASTNQAVEREELQELMRTVIRTAGAIAEETNTPGIMDRFRMPASNNDVVLAATGRAFADAITALNLAAAFTEFGYEGNIVQDLIDEAQDVTDAEAAQGNALSIQAGATASLPGLLRQARIHVNSLSSVVKNRFKNDPAILGAWKSASHVTAIPSGSPPPPPPTSPPAPPAS